MWQKNQNHFTVTLTSMLDIMNDLVRLGFPPKILYTFLNGTSLRAALVSSYFWYYCYNKWWKVRILKFSVCNFLNYPALSNILTEFSSRLVRDQNSVTKAFVRSYRSNESESHSRGTERWVRCYSLGNPTPPPHSPVRNCQYYYRKRSCQVVQHWILWFHCALQIRLATVRIFSRLSDFIFPDGIK
jgi:hypothetical protein